VVGARYGRGIATCLNNGAWSAPAPFVVEGGSWGLQIGGQAIDLVMLVMNQHGMTQLLNSKFKVGIDASAAAGPVGRHAEGSTDWKMRSEILTYSRARGAFAGITLNGAVVKQDDDSTQELYGRVVPFKQLLTGNVPAPASTRTFLADVAKYFHNARTDQNASATHANTAPAMNPSTTGGSSGTASTTTTTNSASAPSGSVSSNTGTATSSNMQAAPSSPTTAAPAAPAESTAPISSTGPSTSTAPATGSTSAAPATESTSGATPSSTGALTNNDVKDLIQRALRNEPSVSSSNVNVVVTESEVQLTGTVPTEADKATIRDIAQQNAGSRKVNASDLTVK
jgi:osmotically-inducible protein OsmY